MKSLFVVLGACLSLVACVAPVDSTETEAVVNQDVSEEPYGGWDKPEGPASCYVVSMLHVVVDGHDFWVQLPTLCDSTPYIFKGDPGPDFGDPYDDRYGTVINEDIMDAFHAKLADPSRKHIAPVE